MEFVPSLELSRMLYQEKLAPIMAQNFPNVKYAATTLGMCSEILGLDDEVSMDHEWGPRVRILLSEQDHARYAQEIMRLFKELLPPKFKGFAMMWRKPGVDVHDTRKSILYHVWVDTVDRALGFCGGLGALPLQEMDWLKISEQHLLEFTSGVVYQDDTGELTKAREQLKYYPDNVLRFLLMSEWNALNGDWFPIGRIGSRGDDLGLRIQTTLIVQRLMRIAYMISKKYAPYKKWFGTLFKQLPIAGTLEPVLLDLLEEGDWEQVEEKLGKAAMILLHQQNRRGITPTITMKPKQVDDGRHHIKHEFGTVAWRIAKHIQPPLKSLPKNQVFWLHERNLILWNGEVGKWSLLLQKER